LGGKVFSHDHHRYERGDQNAPGERDNIPQKYSIEKKRRRNR